jgi:hypothetical protein
MATMEQRMSTVEQDVSSIKATLEHLATKADIARLDAKLEKSVSDLTWRMFGMVVGLMAGIASVVAVVQTVFD